MQAAILDHGIASLGFALEEMAQINVWRNRVEALGLKIGPWLHDLKEAAARGDAEETLVAVEWREPQPTPRGHSLWVNSRARFCSSRWRARTKPVT